MSKFRYIHAAKLPLLAMAIVAFAPSAQAQSVQTQEEEQEDIGADIIVTASMRQGGAQDITHFRSMAIASTGLPEPDSLTLEGLMGEHDLTLPSAKQCDQLFCLVGRSMKADLPTRPDDKMFVGLGFASNIDADSWRKEPLSIMAIVDRSGSMSGEPIEAVKASLRQIVEELDSKDRIGIAIYGTESLVHLPPIFVANNKQLILKAIDNIEIDGSTNLEAGLEMGYEAALKEAQGFKGKVRMMLFTDEQPNTGDTDAGTFMGIATDASRHGIGLTTLGYGVDYDGELATKISSVRGGNVFFVAEAEDGRKLIRKEFRNMVSEVAHDITITMAPNPGYKITGVFGVPDGLMTEGKAGAVTVTVPTAFLSSNGGGIYASLGLDGEAAPLLDGKALMEVDLNYVDAVKGRQGFDRLAITAPDNKPEQQLKLAQNLVDQFLVIDAATRAYHEDGDAKAAFAMLDGLKARTDNASLPGMKEERALIGDLRHKAAYLAGYTESVPASMSPAKVIGKWQILSYQGVSDLSRGDLVEFTEDEEFITYFRRPKRSGAELYQNYKINEKQLTIPEGDLTVNYRVSGDHMYLTSNDGFVKIVMRRADGEEVS